MIKNSPEKAMQIPRRARSASKANRRECRWQRHTSHDGETQKRKHRSAK